MNITRNSIDDLNAVLTVSIEKEDYKGKVEKALENYRKTATIKGFRKGQVPMSFIRKQFEKTMIFEEVNQLLQNGINDYIQKEQLSILGNPLPKQQDDIDWDADQLNFEFELGMAPEFDIDLSKIETTGYKVNVTEEEVQKYVDNFAQRFGTLKPLEAVEEGANIKVELKAGEIEKETFLFADELKASKKFIGKKVGDVIKVKSKDLYEDAANLEQLLEGGYEGDIEFTIKEITKTENSEINQELFDKVYGEGVVSTEEEFRQKIKEESEKMYVRETDKQLMNDVVEELIKNTKFDLPNDFLARWLDFSNEKIESVEHAAEEVKKMEEGLRYQLIEAKVAQKYDLKVAHEDVQEATKKIIKEQFAMYGQSNIPDADLDNIVQSSLGNQQEYQRMADQVFADKMLATFKDNVSVKEKGITFDEFIEVVTEKAKKHNHSHDHDHDHDHDHQH